MAEDEFDEFDDFDSDIANAAQAEAAEEEPQQVQAPVKKLAPFQKKPTNIPQAVTQKPVVPTQQAPVLQRRQSRPMGTKPTPEIRFEGFTAPLRYGLIDNISGQIHAESEDPIKLILALIVELKNDLDEIKQSL